MPSRAKAEDLHRATLECLRRPAVPACRPRTGWLRSPRWIFLVHPHLPSEQNTLRITAPAKVCRQGSPMSGVMTSRISWLPSHLDRPRAELSLTRRKPGDGRATRQPECEMSSSGSHATCMGLSPVKGLFALAGQLICDCCLGFADSSLFGAEKAAGARRRHMERQRIGRKRLQPAPQPFKLGGVDAGASAAG
jgi:hypothetical protein